MKLWNKEYTASTDADKVKGLQIARLEVFDESNKMEFMGYMFFGYVAGEDFFEFGVFKTREEAKDYAAVLGSLITKRRRESQKAKTEL